MTWDAAGPYCSVTLTGNMVTYRVRAAPENAFESNTRSGDPAMSEMRSTLSEMIGKLKQERDELQLKMHLASMDAKDEYNRISEKVDQLTAQYEPLTDAAQETADNVFSALGLAADELKIGYQRVRQAISDQRSSGE